MSSDSSKKERGPKAGGRGGQAGGEPALLIRIYNPVEAEIIIGRLRGAGIDAYAKHEAMSVVYGLTVDGFGQQDILVRAEDLETARAILQAEELGAADLEGSEYGDPEGLEDGDPDTED
jgi:hypothetical protein